MAVIHALAGCVVGGFVGLVLFGALDANYQAWPKSQDVDMLKVMFVGFGSTIGTVIGVHFVRPSPPRT